MNFAVRCHSSFVQAVIAILLVLVVTISGCFIGVAHASPGAKGEYGTDTGPAYFQELLDSFCPYAGREMLMWEVERGGLAVTMTDEEWEMRASMYAYSCRADFRRFMSEYNEARVSAALTQAHAK